MPDVSRLSQRDYETVWRHATALADHASTLATALLLLSPGSRVTETAYQETTEKVVRGMRIHIQRAQTLLAVFELIQITDHPFGLVGEEVPHAPPPP